MSKNSPIGTVSQYRNKVFIKFEKKGEAMSLNCPHYHHWKSLYHFLCTKGFINSENVHYSHKMPTELKQFWKTGHDNNLICYALELGFDFICVEYGHLKNRWMDYMHFWDVDQQKAYNKLSYWDRTNIETAIGNTMNFVRQWNLNESN